MPIKFRCPHCEQFLGISRGKAGALTDCPSCGRTIRIPDLDGSVKPLPGAELDHKDADLAHALDALAQLGQGGSRDGGVAVKPAAAAPAPVREVQPLPLPEPIAIAAPLPAAAASAPAAGSQRPAQHAARTPARDPLEELAGLATAAQLSARYSDRRPSLWTPGVITAAAAAGLVLFGGGFLIGRATSSPARPDAGAASTADAGTTGTVAPAAPPVTAAALTPALTGRITYDSDDGGTKPDAGARIIALPEQRQGTATIAVAGFRAGADEADRQLARASLRTLGGDFVIADEQGQYTIQLPAAGAYQLLILSRHQPRDDAEPLDAALQRTLTAYFDRPTGLVGAVQYHLSTFRFQGGSAAPRDHTFERP
jgi:hypothetical protein